MEFSVTDHDLELRLTVACAIVREAGQLARDYFHRRNNLEIELKGTQDLVSIADRAVEDLIRSQLAQAFPGDDIIGEEGGTEVVRPDAPLWVIDPIDGTANFLRGMPYWSVRARPRDRAPDRDRRDLRPGPRRAVRRAPRPWRHA